MICAHCLLHAPISCGLLRAARNAWGGVARAWRAALMNLAQLG